MFKEMIYVLLAMIVGLTLIMIFIEQSKAKFLVTLFGVKRARIILAVVVFFLLILLSLILIQKPYI